MTDEERILFLLSLGRTIDVPTLPPDAFPLFAFGLGTIGFLWAFLRSRALDRKHRREASSMMPYGPSPARDARDR